LAGDDAATLPEWHLHDLRRTAATLMTGCGINRLTVGKVLNHAEKGVTGLHYDLYDYLPEKRAALERLAARLSAIFDGRVDGEVLHFPIREVGYERR
jgi:integrase